MPLADRSNFLFLRNASQPVWWICGMFFDFLVLGAFVVVWWGIFKIACLHLLCCSIHARKVHA